eukprot:UN02496
MLAESMDFLGVSQKEIKTDAIKPVKVDDQNILATKVEIPALHEIPAENDYGKYQKLAEIHRKRLQALYQEEKEMIKKINQK